MSAEENASATAQCILDKFRAFEAAHDLTVGQLTSRISFLEKRVQDAEARYGALVAAVYSTEGKR